MFSFQNKLKFDNTNICTIRLNIEIFRAFEVRPELTNILVTRDNILHRKRIYFQKDESSIFKNNVKVFRNSPTSSLNE